ncbi:MAG: hypothetical protein AB7F36_04020 [Reyranellaceae bacterium]
MALSLGGVANSQAPDLRDLRIVIDVDMEYESEEVGSDDEPFTHRYATSIYLDAVQGRLVWLGTILGCSGTDRPNLSLVYRPGTHAGEAECPGGRSGTASHWQDRSSQANYRTRLDIKGNVLTLNGEMTGTYSLESLRCGRDHHWTEGTFSIVQSLAFRLVGQTCEVISARMVEEEDEIDSFDTQTVKTTVTTAGPGFSCKVTRRSDPVEPGEKLTRMQVPC